MKTGFSAVWSFLVCSLSIEKLRVLLCSKMLFLPLFQLSMSLGQIRQPGRAGGGGCCSVPWAQPAAGLGGDSQRARAQTQLQRYRYIFMYLFIYMELVEMCCDELMLLGVGWEQPGRGSPSPLPRWVSPWACSPFLSNNPVHPQICSHPKKVIVILGWHWVFCYL